MATGKRGMTVGELIDTINSNVIEISEISQQSDENLIEIINLRNTISNLSPISIGAEPALATNVIGKIAKNNNANQFLNGNGQWTMPIGNVMTVDLLADGSYDEGSNITLNQNFNDYKMLIFRFCGDPAHMFGFILVTPSLQELTNFTQISFMSKNSDNSIFNYFMEVEGQGSGDSLSVSKGQVSTIWGVK